MEKLKEKICTCKRDFIEEGSHYLNCPVLELDLLATPLWRRNKIC
jgi:hypothetical protein